MGTAVVVRARPQSNLEHQDRARRDRKRSRRAAGTHGHMCREAPPSIACTMWILERICTERAVSAKERRKPRETRPVLEAEMTGTGKRRQC